MIGESRMANGEQKSGEFYTVLGLNKECTATELRNAYKKLALRWHPDRCSASENSMFVEESKKKFQAVQQAYSVLSDANKRFLYDVGIYDSDDEDDENGMGDFLSEMAVMMSQTKTNENGEETFEELQQLFQEMFQGDLDAVGSSFQGTSSCTTSHSSCMSYGESSNSNKRNTCEMNSTKSNADGSSSFDAHFQSFCLGENGEETFEEMQQLFQEMFQGDLDAIGSSSQGTSSCSTSSSSHMSYGESSNSNKRNSCEVNSTKSNTDGSSSFDTHFQSFCLGAEHQQDFKKGKGVRDRMAGWARSSRRQGRKQKLSSGHDVSSNDYSSISAS